MERDKLLRFLRKKVDKWKDIEQVLRIAGHDIGIKPHYLSISHHDKHIFSISIADGDIVLDNRNRASKMSGVHFKVLIGDEIQGYEKGIGAMENIPFNQERSLSKLTDHCLDLVLKTGLQEYLSALEVNLVKDNSWIFERLSQEKVENYIGPELKIEPISDLLIQRAISWSDTMSRLPFIFESSSFVNSIYGRMCFVDSEGRYIVEENHRGNMSITATVEHEDLSRVRFFNSFVTNSHPSQLLSIDEAVEESFKQVERIRTATRIESGQYPCIFPHKTVGTLTHETFGAHLLSGKYIKQGVSTAFKGKKGQLIMPEFLTIVDNPQREGSFGFYMFDEEGIRSQKIVLVENGILKNYLLDRDSADYFGTNSNGHSRMQWVMSLDGNGSAAEPEPRISNMEITSSNQVSDGELIEIMKKHCRDNNIDFGLYVESSAGSVNVVDGNFCLIPSRAYKIYPNGKMEEVIDFFITGHPYNILQRIKVTGDTYETNAGLCGAESGWIPTQETAPSAFIPKVNIQTQESVRYKPKLLN